MPLCTYQLHRSVMREKGGRDRQTDRQTNRHFLMIFMIKVPYTCGTFIKKTIRAWFLQDLSVLIFGYVTKNSTLTIWPLVLFLVI